MANAIITIYEVVASISTAMTLPAEPGLFVVRSRAVNHLHREDAPAEAGADTLGVVDDVPLLQLLCLRLLQGSLCLSNLNRVPYRTKKRDFVPAVFDWSSNTNE